MWIPKWYWEAQDRLYRDLERRVERLELMLLKDAQDKIASLQDEKAGSVQSDGLLTITKFMKEPDKVFGIKKRTALEID